MKKLILIAALCGAVAAGAADTKDVLPSARHLEWADCEIGVIIHQDVQVYEPSYEWYKQMGYTPAPTVFNPSSLDTDQWIETAKAAGAKYAVLVAKHCSGFSLWPTKAHDYSVASSPWKGGKGDVVADFIASCRKFGIKPGIYASTGANARLMVSKNEISDTAKWSAYLDVVKTQLTELWTNYGELFEIWFDGGNLPPDKGGREIEDILLRLQPNAVVFQGNPARMTSLRWCGNEDVGSMGLRWLEVAHDLPRDRNGASAIRAFQKARLQALHARCVESSRKRRGRDTRLCTIRVLSLDLGAAV